jgi:hypothetical protein
MLNFPGVLSEFINHYLIIGIIEKILEVKMVAGCGVRVEVRKFQASINKLQTLSKHQSSKSPL